MTTQKVVLKSIDMFMSEYTPIYQPLYPLFLTKSQQYSGEVGKLNFKRVETVGDIRAADITPKDTEIKQIAIAEKTKTYKKYFKANQFVISTMQDQQGVEETVAQVLDEHQRQMDDLFLLGDGSSSSNMLNNGLYFSNDPFYALKASTAIVTGDTRLYDFFNKVVASAKDANRVAGRKVIIFYGDDIIPLFNALFAASAKAVKVALQEVLGPNYSMVEMPSDCTPAGANGWVVANMEQVKTHYTVLPALKDQGTNSEKMYHWFNFVLGSCMVECLAQDAIIRQPATLAV